MSKELVTKLEGIRKKLVQLAEANKKLSARNETLEHELQRTKQRLDEELTKTEELNNKIKIIKLARNMDSPGSENRDVTELKRKLNEYIKEIDNCITMLND